MKILVLGHNGMLGHMVIKYLSYLNIEFKIIKYRWPSINFKNKIIQPTSDCEFSGTLKCGCLYEKNDVKDVTDDYGISKCHISNILISNSNVKKI